MQQLIKHVAEGIKSVDDSRISYRNYHPGVGPYGEPQLVRKIVNFFLENYPVTYKDAKTKRMPDVLIPGKWAVEFKIVRPFGDNGKEAEHWSQNLIHPYEGNVSSIGDAIKLMNSPFQERKGVVVVAYEHNPPIINVDVLVECFEHISRHILDLPLGERYFEIVQELIHPVHQQCKVFGWEIHS